MRIMGCFFFFSSRRRHTRWPRDWSSDVCSSDLRLQGLCQLEPGWSQSTGRLTFDLEPAVRGSIVCEVQHDHRVERFGHDGSEQDLVALKRPIALQLLQKRNLIAPKIFPERRPFRRLAAIRDEDLAGSALLGAQCGQRRAEREKDGNGECSCVL